MPLDISLEMDRLKAIPEIGPLLANALQRIESGVNQLGQNTGSDTQSVPPPPRIQRLNIKTDGFGTVHATVDDNNPIQRGIHYFIEYANEPAFKQPHVMFLGPTRSSPLFTIPSTDDNGAPQSWHFRAYSQYIGGNPSQPVNFGGDAATPVNTNSAIQMSLLPSTGSGTAHSNGQNGGSGFGKVLFRGPLGAKRVEK